MVADKLAYGTVQHGVFEVLLPFPNSGPEIVKYFYFSNPSYTDFSQFSRDSTHTVFVALARCTY